MRAYPYIAVLAVYLLSGKAAGLLWDHPTFRLAATLLLTSALIIIFRKNFSFKLKFDSLALLFGVIIFLVWVAIDLVPYPHPESEPFMPDSSLQVFLRLGVLFLLAPIVEEFFTRFFLMRAIIDKDWSKVREGTFTWASFIITVLFFGFSHNMWLAGLVSGILFNLLYYMRNDIGSCVQAHMYANMSLGIYILATKSWGFW
jgi:uncharacterized protein